MTRDKASCALAVITTLIIGIAVRASDPPDDSDGDVRSQPLNLTLTPGLSSPVWCLPKTSFADGSRIYNVIYRGSPNLFRLRVTNESKNPLRIATADAPWAGGLSVVIKSQSGDASNSRTLTLKNDNHNRLRLILDDSVADLTTVLASGEAIDANLILSSDALEGLPEVEYEVVAELTIPDHQAGRGSRVIRGEDNAIFLLATQRTPTERAIAANRAFSAHKECLDFEAALNDTEVIRSLGREFDVLADTLRMRALEERGGKRNLEEAVQLYEAKLRAAAENALRDLKGWDESTETPEQRIEMLRRQIAFYDDTDPAIAKHSDFLTKLRGVQRDVRAMELGDALEHAQDLVSGHSNCWLAHRELGLTLARMDRRKEAVDALKNALATIDKDPEWELPSWKKRDRKDRDERSAEYKEEINALLQALGEEAGTEGASGSGQK